MAGRSADEAVLLFRPVGPKGAATIVSADDRAVSPSQPDPPIFQPVADSALAVQVARGRNTGIGLKHGIVPRFAVRRDLIDRPGRQMVGGAEHEEYLIPAEEPPAIDANIVGRIEVVASFMEADRIATEEQGMAR